MRVIIGIKAWTVVATLLTLLAVWLGFVVHAAIDRPAPPPLPPPPCQDEAGVYDVGLLWKCRPDQILSAERLWAGVFLYRCTCKR